MGNTDAQDDQDSGEKPFTELMGAAIDEHLSESKDNDDDKDAPGEPEAGQDDEGAKPDGEGRPEGDGKEKEPDEKDADDGTKPPDDDAKSDPDDKKAPDDDKKDDLLEEPDGLSEDASERFQTLANNNRELSAKLDESERKGQGFEDNYSRLADLVDSSNATADEFKELIDFSQNAKSPDLAKRQYAYQMAMNFINTIAPTIGISLGPDPLEGFPDLRTKVDSAEIDEAGAAEIANARRMQQAQQLDQQNKAQATSQQDTQQQNDKDIAVGVQNELGGLLGSWSQDPAWKSKEAMIDEYAQGLTQQVLNGQVHPQAVPELMKRQYDNISKVMAQMVDEQRTRTSANQVMRPSPNVGKGAEPAPKNFVDGMMAAMDKVQGR